MITNKLKEIAADHNYTIQYQERLEALVPKFEAQVAKYGDMYCPCQNVRNDNSVCPCRYMRVYGACKCGLFKEGVTDGNPKEN